MAETHLEGGRRSHHMFWLVLGLILAAVVAWTLLGRGRTRDVATGEVAALPPGEPVAASVTANADDAVGAYVRYTAAHRALADADHTHEYTAEGLRLLATAIAALAARELGGEGALRAQAEELRARADLLQRDPQSTEHAQQAGAAFTAAAGLLQALHERGNLGTADQVTAVRDAASTVSADRLLLRQRSEVQQFFDRASTAVQSMVAPSAS